MARDPRFDAAFEFADQRCKCPDGMSAKTGFAPRAANSAARGDKIEWRAEHFVSAPTLHARKAKISAPFRKPRQYS